LERKENCQKMVRGGKEEVVVLERSEKKSAMRKRAEADQAPTISLSEKQK